MIQATYSEARDNLASLMDRVTQNREKVIIKRRGHPDVVLIAADELEGLEETAYLLRSPANARRLIEGLAEAERGEGVVVSGADLDALQREIGQLVKTRQSGVPPTLERLIRETRGSGSARA